jgi:hypothetical protein
MANAIQLKSTTLESQLQECLIALNQLELSATNATNNVRVSIDLDNGSLTANVTLPIESIIDSTGKVVIQAKPYL